MSPDPNAIRSEKVVVTPPLTLEQNTKNNKCLFKVLTSIATLVSVGVVASIICASLALIPWSIAAIPITIGLIIVALSLILLKKTSKKIAELKALIQSREKSKIPIEKKPEDSPLSLNPSLKNFSSILSSEDLKTMLFPSEQELSTDPTIWFSRRRLQEAFSKEWSFIFGRINSEGYKNPKSETVLTLQAGNIATFHTPSSPDKRGAIVNAANANMTPGGAGTNAALSQTVTPASWDASKEGKASLQVSEVSVGQWVSQNPVEDNTLEPAYLFQALGPEASRYPDTFQGYEILITTYLNCFERANSLKVTHLQLPLISSANFGSLQRGWPIMTKLAFLTALTLFLEKNPKNNLKNIVMIDLKSPPHFT